MDRRIIAVLIAAVLATMGCAAAGPGEPVVASVAPGEVVVIEMDDMVYRPQRLEVPAGEPVTVRLENHGGIVHDLVFDDGWDSGEVVPGGGITVEIGPFEADTVGWCSVPGHRDAGMELEIVVRDP